MKLMKFMLLLHFICNFLCMYMVVIFTRVFIFYRSQNNSKNTVTHLTVSVDVDTLDLKHENF